MLDTIEEGIEAIKNGQLIIVVDDESRENEGDFIIAAESITPEIVNFMARQGRGLICTALPEARCDQLALPPMVANNTVLQETAFTVSVDLLGHGCTTGISASDRAKTIKALNNLATDPSDLGRPGHSFPLRSKQGGVLSRMGHTEAATDLVRLAGFSYPYGAVLVEIMNEDGTMSRLPDLVEVKKKFGLKLISIKDLVEYRLRQDSLIEEIVRVNMPTRWGHFTLAGFKDKNSHLEHLALIKGEWEKDEPVLTGIHTSCFAGDVLGSLHGGYNDYLQQAMQMLEQEGKGVAICINQESAGMGLMNKLQAFNPKKNIMNTAECNLQQDFKTGESDYKTAAQILHHLNITKLRFISSSPHKYIDLTGYGLEIAENVPIVQPLSEGNKMDICTKKEKMRMSNLVSW
ncbi:MAG TPA: 3,4-dihydroxy-2-butanone-4-phosphate synthase [Niabella sp.]|nr:3,4-dihydroxy-2-butanone-4-phosphate synthase [Niabella sp.]